MVGQIPVVGSLPFLGPDEDPVVVEADPEGSATRAVKAVARHVYRLIQEFEWAGHDGAVLVAVAGEAMSALPLGPNLGLLLAPLVTTAIGERVGDTSASVLLEADDHTTREGASGVGAFVSPRDRVWIVPDASLRDRDTRDLFELVILEAGPDAPIDDVDVLVIVTAFGEAAAVPEGVREDVEAAAVLVGGPADHPTTVAVAD